MPATELTPEIIQVLVVLGAALILLVTEALRVDIVALLVLLTVAWLGLVTPDQAFSGLSSRAVVAILAIMILGHGLERSGVTRLMTRPLINAAGGGSTRLLVIVMAATALVSAFMQNVGAAALFLPIVVRISKQTGTPASRMLLPMGFAAILGGTLTMVASSPVILLNELLLAEGLEPFGLFAVTPIGLALLLCCLTALMLFGKKLLPAEASRDKLAERQSEMVRSWDLDHRITELVVPPNSGIIGRTREEVEMVSLFGLHLVAITANGETMYAPWRQARFAAGQRLAMLGNPKEAARFAATHGLGRKSTLLHFPELEGTAHVGFAEVLIAPRGELVGKTLLDAQMRLNFGVEPIALISGGVADERELFTRKLMPGDTLVVHGPWEQIREVGRSADYTVITHLDGEATDPSKMVPAAISFFGAIGMALAGLPLALSLFTGVIAMVLTGVLKMDEAYRAVSWRTVFLLAGLIPLGLAFRDTGAAAYIAEHMVSILGDAPLTVVLLSMGVLTTMFSLFSSNVASTLMLVPLFADVARRYGIDPRPVALLVAICAQNSFLLPTHQVNALLMGPGGYRNRDYLRAGGVVTVVFLAVVVGCIQLMIELG